MRIQQWVRLVIPLHALAFELLRREVLFVYNLDMKENMLIHLAYLGRVQSSIICGSLL